ncbi:F-box/LRR-repeat protein 6 [Halyomorpha halys]|uniref:F-box/LRR-repeat protein 6 n=1 Tax=Halyomorpha halys TaxID=286706 RepID=UPI0006D4EEEE|nr:F-box/LRR-repeat protein 6 [Halyomorpha halys]
MMDDRNGCFDHDDLFARLGADSDCLKDFILEPMPLSVPPLLPTQPPPIPQISWNNGQIHYPTPISNVDPLGLPHEDVLSLPHDGGLSLPHDPGLILPHEHCLNQPQDHVYPTEMETVPVTNGDCWSPAGFVGASPAGFTTASASERTVSSDCVSSETMCSPSEGTSDSPSGSKNVGNFETLETQKKRGRKKRTTEKKRHTTVATYHSQISPEQNGIILKIRKSVTEVPQKNRKRRQKETERYEEEYEEPEVQSGWGNHLPKLVLHKIFQMVTRTEGCVPFLVRVSRVCRLWREVAISPRLWQHVDLASTWVKDRAKNDLKFRWLCENRLALVHDLNIGGWEFDGIPTILDKLASSCGELRGLSLTGWQGLSAEHVKFLVSHCPKLQRLDLSSINPEMGNPRSAVSMLSLVSLAQEMGERLTQLVLSDNKLSGIPQIVSALASCCPNLQVLDLSNVRTVSHTTVHLHIEKLQKGCPKLRVLRITNSELAIAAVSLKEQSLSEGFPMLEELSVADTAGTMCAQPVIDDDSLQRILKSSHKLRLLDVRGCSRVTGNSLVRLPAWDLEHLFLSGCYVTRINDSGLELICQKWAHSLIEVDLAWSTATLPLDQAVAALASPDHSSPLRVLNLCGSSVSLEPVKSVLARCPMLSSLNLSSCRAMPRGIKRLYSGQALSQLRANMAKEQE